MAYRGNICSLEDPTERRCARTAARDQLLADYQLHIATVVWDYDMTGRAEAPTENRAATRKHLIMFGLEFQSNRPVVLRGWR